MQPPSEQDVQTVLRCIPKRGGGGGSVNANCVAWMNAVTSGDQDTQNNIIDNNGGQNPCNMSGSAAPQGAGGTTSAACKKYLKAVASGGKIPKYNPCPTQAGGSANSAGNGCANHPDNPACKTVAPK